MNSGKMKQQAVNPFVRQRYFNRASQVSWREFAAHRDQITSRLEAVAAPADAFRSLCVLGAGNCNDLDLVRLTSHWSKIRLMDIDAEAMQAGVAHQFQTATETSPKRHQPIEITACDLTGAMEHCHEITRTPSSEAIAKLRRALALLPALAQVQERFSAVASTCLLSQLIDVVQHSVGASNPELPSLAELVRLQHLRTLAELTAPGGTMLLFADFVSSETVPELPGAPKEALPVFMEKVLREHGCFTGMNPSNICRLLNQPPLASYWAEPPTMSEPWLWNLGPRTYLVTAIVGRRKQISSPLSVSLTA